LGGVPFGVLAWGGALAASLRKISAPVAKDAEPNVMRLYAAFRSGWPCHERALQRRYERDELVVGVAVAAREGDELAGAGNDLGAVWLGGDANAAAAAELDDALVAQVAQSTQNGVGVDAQDGRHIARRRQPFAGRGLAVGDRAAERGRDLLVQIQRRVAVELDADHGASDTSFMSGIAAAPSLDPLIAAARRRTRRRRAGVVAIAAATAAAGWVVTRDGRERVAPVLPRLELRKEPGMGVACPAAPNSIACDRIAIAVQLWRLGPRVIRATVGGRTAVLRPQDGVPFYLGYLQPAGLIDGPLKVIPDHGRFGWFGDHPKFAVMTIRAKGYAPVRRRVELSTGWG
jgi:hypothetical protein